MPNGLWAGSDGGEAHDRGASVTTGSPVGRPWCSVPLMKGSPGW